MIKLMLRADEKAMFGGVGGYCGYGGGETPCSEVGSSPNRVSKRTKSCDMFKATEKTDSLVAASLAWMTYTFPRESQTAVPPESRKQIDQ